MDANTIKMITENMQEFYAHAEKIAADYAKTKYINYRYIDRLYFEESNENNMCIVIETSHCSCCNDQETIWMPWEYLWDTEWREKAIKQFDQEKIDNERIERELAEKTEREQIERREQKDLEEYERLTKKYEGK